MTTEEKQLLLKDLCARLPYGVIVKYKRQESEGNVKLGYGNINYVAELGTGWWEDCKPYLRPMSSMTDEEIKELKHLIAFSGSPDGAANLVDWLNKKMFAYRTIDGKDMFKLGLALEAPEGMYKEE